MNASPRLATPKAPLSVLMTPSPDLELSCTVDIPPLVPEGTYEAIFLRAEKARIWDKRQKIFLHFRIIQPGEYFGRELFMVVTFPISGRLSLSSKYLQQWTLAAGQAPTRRDRLSTRVFRDKVFLAQVRTVVKDAQGHERPKSARYSVIDKLVEVRTGRAGL